MDSYFLKIIVLNYCIWIRCIRLLYKILLSNNYTSCDLLIIIIYSKILCNSHFFFFNYKKKTPKHSGFIRIIFILLFINVMVSIVCGHSKLVFVVHIISLTLTHRYLNYYTHWYERYIIYRQVILWGVSYFDTAMCFFFCFLFHQINP